MKSVHGEAFNKTLIESHLNKSGSKASYGFSRAKRFSTISVNNEGFAITMVAPSQNNKTSGGFPVSITKASTSSPSKQHFNMPGSSLPKNMNNKKSGSI